LTAADIHSVFELEAAGETYDDGTVEVSESDIESDWSRPDFNPETMSLGAFAGRSLVAYALVFQGRAEALVHPDYRGKGLGTRLAEWTWPVARAEGRDRVGQTISDDERSAAALFTALGYQRGHSAWILRADLSERQGAPELPAGYRFRPYLPGVDDRSIYELIDEAFSEWRNADSEPMGFENWVACMLHEISPRFVVVLEQTESTCPSNADTPGRLVGAAVCQDYPTDGEGSIEQVAVQRELRGRGLGQALLIESFRRFQEAGRIRAVVSTDSRTGALGFYEHAGMRMVRSYTRWVKVGL
jgi:ribosomal protein S18 acetylase RimI-like enzyme